MGKSSSLQPSFSVRGFQQQFGSVFCAMASARDSPGSAEAVFQSCFPGTGCQTSRAECPDNTEEWSSARWEALGAGWEGEDISWPWFWQEEPRPGGFHQSCRMGHGAWVGEMGRRGFRRCFGTPGEEGV